MNNLLELAVRIFNDTLPKSCDAAFLYSQTPQNQPSVAISGKKIVKNDLADKLLIMQTKAMSGYGGYQFFKDELLENAIPETKIEGVSSDDDKMLHTLIESLSVVAHCKEKKYKTLLVCATPFHQLRAYMTAVSATLRIYPELKVYSYTGEPFSWTESVVHSQGKTEGKRAELIHGEIERIKIYGEKGDLISVDETLAYLNQRD
ncbi:YdcF family protein [Chondrinema litorale]|uniref:YdcF family protein n=1 Tax=Chondrinema litorale TaxID=2994555 RepID=UPI00254334DB|nr:YdcF family protein [Chondrinema litorale]UZR96022.1 YdcF family protein [Chondrinema litorale]